MSEPSRRVDIEVFKDEPLSLDGFIASGEVVTNDLYQRYLDHFQPYRWHAVAANNEIIAHGESYYNLADCINAIELLCGDNTTVYYAPMFGEDRGFRWLRFGATDRASQAGQ